MRYFWQRLRQLLRLMIGLPDYQRYLEHRRLRHPDEAVLSEPEFVAQRQQARYGKGASRCC